jgi:hypothetical protein
VAMVLSVVLIQALRDDLRGHAVPALD